MSNKPDMIKPKEKKGKTRPSKDFLDFLDKKDKIGLSVAVPGAIGMYAAIFKKLKEYDKKGKEYMNPSRKPQTLKDG